jgi:WD40 repeat protein
MNSRPSVVLLTLVAAASACKSRGSDPKPPPVAPKASDPLPTGDLHGDPLPSGALARMGTLRLRHECSVSAIEFSPDGKVMATSSGDGTIRLWQTTTGKPIKTIHAYPELEGMTPRKWRQRRLEPGFHRTGPSSLAFSPDGKALVSNRPLVIWDAQTGKKVKGLSIKSPAWLVTFSPDGKRIASTHRGFGKKKEEFFIAIWDAKTGEVQREVRGHDATIHGLSFLPDSTSLMSLSSDKTARLWNVHSGREITKHRLPDKGLRLFAVAGDGKTAAAAGNSELVFMDMESGRISSAETSPDSGRTATFAGMAFTSDGKHLATLDEDGAFWLWDKNTGRKKRLDLGTVGELSVIAFSKDGKWLALGGGVAATRSVVHVFQLPKHAKAHNVAGHEAAVSAVAISPDNKLLATGSAVGPIHLWEARTGKHLRRLKGHLGTVFSLAFSPRGDVLVSGGADATVREYGKTIRIWQVATGKMLRALDSKSWTRSVAVSADGAMVVTAGQDRLFSSRDRPAAVRLWDLRSGKLLRKLSDHQSPDRCPGALARWQAARLCWWS